MTTTMIYGIYEGHVFAASGPALLRSISAGVVGNEEPFTMGQLRALMGERVADQLVLEEDPDDDAEVPPQRVRPIADEAVLTLDDVGMDNLEHFLWIENIMDDLPASVRALGQGRGYRSGLKIPEERMGDFETLMRQAGIELVRDDSLITAVHDNTVDLKRAFAAKERIERLTGAWSADAE